MSPNQDKPVNGHQVNSFGIPVIPFALLWPVIKLIAVPLIKALWPWISAKINEALQTGQPVTFSDAELAEAIDQQQPQMHAVYRGG